MSAKNNYFRRVSRRGLPACRSHPGGKPGQEEPETPEMKLAIIDKPHARARARWSTRSPEKKRHRLGDRGHHARRRGYAALSWTATTSWPLTPRASAAKSFQDRIEHFAFDRATRLRRTLRRRCSSDRRDRGGQPGRSPARAAGAEVPQAGDPRREQVGLGRGQLRPGRQAQGAEASTPEIYEEYHPQGVQGPPLRPRSPS